jgi:hypothetical protein
VQDERAARVERLPKDAHRAHVVLDVLDVVDAHDEIETIVKRERRDVTDLEVAVRDAGVMRDLRRALDEIGLDVDAGYLRLRMHLRELHREHAVAATGIEDRPVVAARLGKDPAHTDPQSVGRCADKPHIRALEASERRVERQLRAAEPLHRPAASR